MNITKFSKCKIVPRCQTSSTLNSFENKYIAQMSKQITYDIYLSNDGDVWWCHKIMLLQHNLLTHDDAKDRFIARPTTKPSVVVNIFWNLKRMIWLSRQQQNLPSWMQYSISSRCWDHSQSAQKITNVFIWCGIGRMDTCIPK